MAAGIVSAQQTFSGLRPVRLRRDLADIADLIERCFAPMLDVAGRSAIREMRALSRSGPLLWALSSLSGAVPGLMQGFVWIEKDRLVGNVTITPAGYGRGWVIANVAVHPDYRRRGIARQLVRAAMDQVAERGAFATLQVDADNDAARALYAGLGFHTQRTFIRWRRMTHHPLPAPVPQMPPLRRMTRRDTDRLYALAVRVRPDERGGMGWLRPTDKKVCRPARWHRWRRLLSGTGTDYWVVPGADGPLVGAVIAETRVGRSTARFDLLVHPDHQDLTVPLVTTAIRRLEGDYRPLATEHPADDQATNDVLQQNHFWADRTLTHMIWSASPNRPTH